MLTMLTLLLNLRSAGEVVPAVDTVSGKRVTSAGAACDTSSSEVSEPPSEPSESERGMAGNASRRRLGIALKRATSSFPSRAHWPFSRGTPMVTTQAGSHHTQRAVHFY
jgi:hypothetical protein